MRGRKNMSDRLTPEQLGETLGMMAMASSTDGVEDLHGMLIWCQNIGRQACLFPIEDYRAVLSEIDRMETVMPLTDPTAYMKIMDTMPSHKRLVEAVLAFRLTLEKLRP